MHGAASVELHAPAAECVLYKRVKPPASASKRSLQIDSEGVGEPLNETMCGCRDCYCPGLVARGTVQLLFAPAAAAAAPARAAAAAAADPALVLAARGRDVLAWASRQMFSGANGAGNGGVVGGAQGGSGASAEARKPEELGTTALVVQRLLALGQHGAALARPFTRSHSRSTQSFLLALLPRASGGPVLGVLWSFQDLVLCNHVSAAW